MTPLHARLLAWYDENCRDLPWRDSPTPYAVWVSEAMLQQTTVTAVLPYFERWMDRFPTVECLAQANEDEVAAVWAGLGYYSRGRRLLEGARTVVRQGWPRDAAEWRKVPGVGVYTAGALASIALGQRAALVDGNVERVFARLAACEASGSALRKAAWDWAERSVPAQRPGDWNQALMELGATVCRPKSPHCERCPVSAYCEAFRKGVASQIPAARKRPDWTPLEHVILVPRYRGLFGVQASAKGEWWGGLWGFPRGDRLTDLHDLAGCRSSEALGSFCHTVTRFKIKVEVRLGEAESAVPSLSWEPLDTLAMRPLPSPQKRALSILSRRLAGDCQPTLV